MNPYRSRTPSGHDVPIPESVFHAIRAVQDDHAETRGEVRQLAGKVNEVALGVAKIAEAAAKREASWKDKAVTQIGAVVLAVVAAVGGGRLVAKDPPAPVVAPTRALIDIRQDECRPLPPGSQARYECFARIYAETEGQRR